jgi:DNA anti-recombination protein RmuC
MTGAEYVLGLLLVLALVAVVYLLSDRRTSGAGGSPVSFSLDPRVQSALDFLPRLQQELGGLKASVQSLPTEATIRSIDGRLSAIESRVPSSLETNLQKLDATLVSIHSEYGPGNRFEQIYQATNRLISLLAGGRGRGTAGEAILGDVLKAFPPTMLERDFKVDGKSVEFALILPNSKRLPIDSKWTAADLVERLGKATTPDAEERLAAEIEKAVVAKASEVAKYRNPAVTTDIGIAAVPDSVYRVCLKAHLQAYEQWSVLVVPYSMLAPYLLAFYSIHMKYGRALELSNLQAYLNVIEQEVKIIDGDLEGRIKEAGTRANNAYESIKSAVARIRSAAENLKTPSVEIAPTPAAQQEEKSWWASAQA